MNIKLLNYENIKNVMQKKNYKFYTGKYNVNKIGIRTADTTPNVFNDYFVELFENEMGEKRCHISKGTTDPGLYYLQNPMNVEGTAILKPGQYISIWEIGLHKNKYEAFVQCNPCTVWRDANRNDYLDMEGPEYTGIFGINQHRAHESLQVQTIEKYSAGCQVYQSRSDLEYALLIGKLQERNGYGRKFTYTLLTENDFL